jgi:TolB protein
MKTSNGYTIASCLLLMAPISTFSQGTTPSFDRSGNVGHVLYAGMFERLPGRGHFRVRGGGENIWGTRDAFYFAFRQVRGDLVLTADVHWVGVGKQPHRKAGWMIRADTGEDAPYVDALLHGDGLISMQYRKERGGVTAEVKYPSMGAAHMILERHGSQFSLTVAGVDGALHPVGTISVPLPDECHAGLAVCSHDSSVLETAEFTHVGLDMPGTEGGERIVESTLETIDITTGVRTIIRRAKEHFEAPNWSRDGTFFIYNSGGRLYTLPVIGGSPRELPTGTAVHCNNDHGLSGDGKTLAISNHAADGKSLIYTLPAEGGEPREVTVNGPSYWHGWSPDGSTLAYCAERNGLFDVYVIPVTGGVERRLTDAPGLDDGPDYSPDGRYIYFNSIRTGQMKIWRMKSDGSEQTQITPDDEYGDWFAHPSPDGRWLIYVSFDKMVDGHPPNKDVVLRLMPASGGEPKTIAVLFGGQGTMNVPSWSPDSKRVAFVSYRLVRP